MRLIDANEMAIQESEAYLNVNTREDINPITWGINSVVHRKIQELIANTPTIDPASLRAKGEWSTGYYVENGRYVWDCSNCCLPNDNLADFCPNCGADMRGDNDGA